MIGSLNLDMSIPKSGKAYMALHMRDYLFRIYVQSVLKSTATCKALSHPSVGHIRGDPSMFVLTVDSFGAKYV